MRWKWLRGRFVKLFNILVIFILIIGCGKKNSQLTTEAIDVALTHLSKEECDEALKVLLKLDGEEENPIYIQVLASAYACKADYKEINFLEDDLTTLTTTSAVTIMTSLTKMTMSSQTVADSDDYVSILKGINTLLGATYGTPGQLARNQKFGIRRASYLGIQALLLQLVNFGKFLHFYGNVDNTGSKGQGGNTNTCFLNYTHLDAAFLINAGLGGICNTTNDGHPDLDLSSSDGKRRACEGVVLVANIIDIIDNLELGENNDLKVLEDFSEEINLFLDIAEQDGLGQFVTMTSQSDCETALNTPSNLDDLQTYYVLIFEKGLQ